MRSATTADSETYLARQKRSYLWLWVALIAVIVAAGGITLWLVLGGDDQPTIGFDGSEATYSGPEIIEAGEVPFKTENNSDVVVDFLWGRHSEEGITLEQTVAWAESSTDQPPWVEEGFHLVKDQAANSSGERVSWMTAGTYELVVWEVQAEKAHIAALITVVDT